MGYIALGVFGFTILSLIIDVLMGLWRGRNRAILRLILVLVSAVAAFFLKDVIANLLMGINIGGSSMNDLLAEMFVQEGGSIPESVQNLVSSMIEIIFGLMTFILTFIVLRIVTFAIVYPICKIFIKKGKKRRKLFGAVTGLVQGVIIAFVICAPVTGLVNQVGKLSEIEMNGEKLMPVSETIGFDTYSSSVPGKVYSASGSWFFDMLTTKKDADGKTISLKGTVNVIVAVSDIGNEARVIAENMEKIVADGSTSQDKIDGLVAIGESLEKIETSIEQLGDSEKEMVNELISSIGETAALDNFDANNLGLAEAGNAMNGIADYIEKTNENFENYGEEITQSEVDNIVNGIAGSPFMMSILTDGEEVTPIVQVDDSNKSKFETAISSAEISDEDKTSLRQLFGLE